MREGSRSPYRLSTALTAFAVLCTFLCSGSARAELSARSQVGSGPLAVQESAQWTVILEGSGTSAPEPEFRNPNWAQITHVGTEQSMRIENGRMSSAVVYRFLVVPLRSGRHALPAVTFRVGQSRVTTEPVPVSVVQESMPRQLSPGGDESLRLVVSLGASECVVGEAVRMTVRFYQATRLSQQQYWGPATPGFWAEPTSEPRSYYLEEGGRRWLVTESHAFLYPTVTGELTVGTARMLCLLETAPGRTTTPLQLGSPREEIVTVESEPVSIRVVDLPAAGRPSSFAAGVGAFQLGVRTGRDSIRADETIELLVELSGTGNLRIAGTPEWDELDDFEIYARRTEDDIDLTGEVPHGSRRTYYSLLPRRQGMLEVPALSYGFYTPGEGYRRVGVAARAIHVGPPIGRLAGAGSVVPLTVPEGVVRPPRSWLGWLASGIGAIGLAWAVAWLVRLHRGRRSSAAGRHAARRAELAALAKSASPAEFLRQAEAWLSREAPSAGGEAGAARSMLLERVRGLRYGGQESGATVRDVAAALDRQVREAERTTGSRRPFAIWLLLAAAILCLAGGAGFGMLRWRAQAPTAAFLDGWSAAVQSLEDGADRAAEEALDGLWRDGWRGGPLAAQAALAALHGRRLGRAALWMERARREDPGHPFVQTVRRTLDEEGALPGHPEGLAARWSPRDAALITVVILLLAQLAWIRAWLGGRFWRWPAAVLSVAAAAAAVTAATLAAAGFGERAGVLQRSSPLHAEPGGIADLDLEAGRLVEVFEGKDGFRRVGLGGGLEGWVREADVVAVRVAPAAGEGTAQGSVGFAGNGLGNRDKAPEPGVQRLQARAQAGRQTRARPRRRRSHGSPR